MNNNAALSQERFLWNDDPTLASNWSFSPVDFASTAEAFGCAAYRIESPGELGRALSAALEAKKPAVIEVLSDPMIMSPPSWAPSERGLAYGGAA